MKKSETNNPIERATLKDVSTSHHIRQESDIAPLPGARDFSRIVRDGNGELTLSHDIDQSNEHGTLRSIPKFEVQDCPTTIIYSDKICDQDFSTAEKLEIDDGEEISTNSFSNSVESQLQKYQDISQPNSNLTIDGTGKAAPPPIMTPAVSKATIVDNEIHKGSNITPQGHAKLVTTDSQTCISVDVRFDDDIGIDFDKARHKLISGYTNYNSDADGNNNIVDALQTIRGVNDSSYHHNNGTNHQKRNKIELCIFFFQSISHLTTS